MCQAPPSSVPEQAARCQRRRVSFAMDPNNEVTVQVKFIDTSLATGEKTKLFWSKKEKRHIHRSAWAVIKQVTQQDRFNSFHHDNGNVDTNYEFDYVPLLLRAFYSCDTSSSRNHQEELTDEERYYLTEWMVYGEARRGLERNCIERLNASMTKRKKRAIDTVLMMHGTVTDGIVSPDQEEMIANVYRELSAQSQRFAELMGQVDEGAVRQEEANESDKENNNNDNNANASMHSTKRRGSTASF